MIQKLFMFIIGVVLVLIGMAGFSAREPVMATTSNQPVAMAAPRPGQVAARTTPTPVLSMVQPEPQPAPRPADMVTTAVISQNSPRTWPGLLPIALLLGTVAVLLGWMIRLNWHQAQHQQTAVQSISVEGVAS